MTVAEATSLPVSASMLIRNQHEVIFELRPDGAKDFQKNTVIGSRGLWGGDLRGFNILSLNWVYIRAVFLVRTWEGLVAAMGSLSALSAWAAGIVRHGRGIDIRLSGLLICLIWIVFH